VQTDTLFGLDGKGLEASERRHAGFDQGRWATRAELDFIAEQKRRLTGKKRFSAKLYQQEADIALAARSFAAVVLTDDSKRGPIRDAQRQGGKVVFLTAVEQSGISLREAVRAAASQA
jgi:hypothetical protein